MKKKKSVLTVGWREYVSLPDFSLSNIKAKIDTGAKTTALHASNIRRYEQDGKPWVAFHPEHPELAETALVNAPIHAVRAITNTSGIPEDRIIIITPINIAGRIKRVEISLADRKDMKYPMIIGRTTLRVHRLVVDSARSWRTEPHDDDSAVVTEDDASPNAQNTP